MRELPTLDTTLGRRSGQARPDRQLAQPREVIKIIMRCGHIHFEAAKSDTSRITEP